MLILINLMGSVNAQFTRSQTSFVYGRNLIRLLED